ncbi:hypothetical protein [Brumimicrobium sp.]|uniref:hypothetical protein n=1 Tax=Brumimicrobium sp. TaxID=2029867 RepID=UPI003A8CD735
MNRNRMLYLIFAVVLVGALLVVFLNAGSKSTPSTQQQHKKAFTSSNWKVDLALEDKNPYGLYAFRELAVADGRFTVFNDYSSYQLLDSITRLDSSIMMYIGLEFMLTDEETDLLLQGIEYGSSFFLSSEKLPPYLLEKLFDENPLTFIPKKKAPHKINDQLYNMYYYYENDTLTEIWDMFHKHELDAHTQIHSTIFGRPNFIEIPYGLGKIYLHLNPLVFTNVQVLKKEGKAYLKEVFSKIDQPHIQWLSFAKYEPIEYDPSSGEFEEDHSLLSELFKHPAFRWGFILAVFGLLLYLLFRSKRRRPIIPAKEDNKNTGFSYVDTLAGIYFNKNHGDKMLKIMRRNFYSAVYEHFYIDLAKREDHKALISLSKKSNVPLEEIDQLLKFLEATTKVSDIYLGNTYKVQREFYFKSGIWNKEVRNKLASGPVTLYRQKSQAIGTIFLGAFIILLGFIFLSLSLGVGVLFWPIGIVAIAIGTRMLNTPALVLNRDLIEINPLWRRKSLILHENIKFIEENRQNLIIYLKNGEQSTLNISSLDTKNKKALDNLIKRFKPT